MGLWGVGWFSEEIEKKELQLSMTKNPEERAILKKEIEELREQQEIHKKQGK